MFVIEVALADGRNRVRFLSSVFEIPFYFKHLREKSDGHRVHRKFFYGNKQLWKLSRLCGIATLHVHHKLSMLKSEEISRPSDQLRPVKPYMDRKDVME